MNTSCLNSNLDPAVGEVTTTSADRAFPQGRWNDRTLDISMEASPDDARRILAAAIAILRQGEELLAVISPEAYARRVPLVFNASAGGHYRHCLDHFVSLWRGLEAAAVDYDHRERDPRLETQPGAALKLTRELRRRLETLPIERLDDPVQARCEVSYAHGQSPVTRSTFARELVYAIAHAIHHYALISVIARVQEVPLPANFGLAPSTVAHEQRQAQLASHGS